MKTHQPVAIVCIFTWIGFVCAISFLEAWLKFQAPGVTIPIGLGIGRLVFSALNKIEWVFAVAVLGSAFLSRNGLRWPLWIAIAILVAETVWLLPALDARAEEMIHHRPVPPSRLHIMYIAMEGVKVLALLAGGLALFKSTRYR